MTDCLADLETEGALDFVQGEHDDPVIAALRDAAEDDEPWIARDEACDGRGSRTSRGRAADPARRDQAHVRALWNADHSDVAKGFLLERITALRPAKMSEVCRARRLRDQLPRHLPRGASWRPDGQRDLAAQPSQRTKRPRPKRQLYLTAGVRALWLADPDRLTVGWVGEGECRSIRHSGLIDLSV